MPIQPANTLLRRGDISPAVRDLQARLNARGYHCGEADGEFGRRTEAALVLFQQQHSLAPDGVAGPATWAALGEPGKPAGKPAAKPTGKPDLAEIARNGLIAVAKRDVGLQEVTRNRAPFIKRYWPATSYPEGYANREPYCAAACCFWLKTVGEELAAAGWLAGATGGKTLAQFESWRCKSAAAYGWLDWAKRQGLAVLPDSATPKPGDFVVYDFSHIGLVTGVPRKGRIATLEANTGPSGERDGDGCWAKDRPQEIARAFIRVFA